ncbi:hypothetical protein C483_12268 [Natrialba hulunbeirensis JCM 10989]|uniref:Uncharacterized protein n=1 Tax=Natrialba hulunbeirensis JCM 10989 TaxID=1227493 RepID=L9ZVB1_9EURY|nr:hypothetical protein [Natrialba hulunbeirensis]ELY90284.1 hypothetical protein C483_12268 [Natrialba hulunbeirensis JCM 10989]
MAGHPQLLPELVGTAVAVGYCLWVYGIIAGYLPVWSTFLLGIAAIPIVLWRADCRGISESTVYALTRGVVVTLPALILLLLLSGFGRLLRSSFRVFRAEPLARMHSEGQVDPYLSMTSVADVTIPYSLLFGEYFTGESTVAEEAFAFVVFDPYLLLIAMETTVLFVLGCGISGLWYGWRRRPVSEPESATS